MIRCFGTSWHDVCNVDLRLTKCLVIMSGYSEQMLKSDKVTGKIWFFEKQYCTFASSEDKGMFP